MKKLFSALLAAVILTNPVSAAVIYEDTTTTTITRGITHQVIDTFTESGWCKADVVRIDLTDEDLQLKVMTSPDGTSSLATVKTMAEEYDTKVAVNADFFNLQSGETNMLGMVYQNGELISTPSKDNFVSFAVTEDNRVIFDYFTFSGKMYAENITYAEYVEHDIYQINKVPVTDGTITMITSAWGKEVAIPDYCYAIICEHYKGNQYKMTGYSWGSEKVAIPTGGAVFVTNYASNNFLNIFTMDDVITVEASISPDIEGIVEASGGNTLLVKDGEVSEFTSNITGKAQRTAMGLSRSGNTLVLVTVDGRQADCVGFDQTELAEFMISLGCDTAINLDGGGSTTLVTPDRFTGAQTVTNEVSSQRKVSTALGVISFAEVEDAAFGEIKLSKDTIIAGDSVDVSYVFYDENHNITPVEADDVTITCSDPYAIIDSNRVMPTTKGTHTIKVKHNRITAEATVTVLGDIFAINIYPEQTMTYERDKTFMVTAYDTNGHSAVIPTYLVTYETEGDITLEGATVKKGDGKGFVTARYENLTSVAVVNGEKYERQDDIKNTDIFEGFIDNSPKITVTGKILTPKNFIGRFQTKAHLTDLTTRGDVYALDESIYDPWGIFTVYRNANGYTERVIENTRIVTIANTKSSSIRLTETNAWANFKYMCENIEEANLVITTNEPVYNMNAGEKKVWDYYIKQLTDKGINVFVVSTGEKSEATVENGVRYLYVGSVGDTTNLAYEYGLKSAAPLTFTFSGDEIKYAFE